VRIIHFLNHTRKANGHVEIAIDLACAQAAQGHQVAMLSGPGHFDDVLRENGVTRVVIPDTESRYRAFTMAWALTKLARSFRADIVNAHMVSSALVARTVQLQGRFHLVTTIHNSFDKAAVYMRVGERVIAVSDAVKTQMTERGIPAHKLRTVRNCTIGGKRRPPLPAQRRELVHPAITTVCGLHPRKGIVDLLDAFAIATRKVPDAQLYIVGDGPLKGEFQARANASHCRDNIHWVGHQRDPREFLADSDIFVLASHADPCPLVIPEARQMGCAIIATHVDGIPELLSFGKKGMLVPAKNPTALSEALATLLSDEPLRKQYASAAHSDLEECYVEKMSSETIAVYSELLSA
jgi:glycosyltransferase involved in cell wall biosynthesis